LKILLDKQAQLLDSTTQTERRAQQLLQDSERSRELLVLDKMALQREVAGVESRCSDLSKELEHARSNAIGMELKVILTSSCLLNYISFDDVTLTFALNYSTIFRLLSWVTS
jgi:hypothetical protein